MSLLFERSPIGLLSDEDATLIGANFDSAPEQDKALYAAKLNEYSEFRKHYPRPLTFEETQKATQERTRVEALFDDFDKAAEGVKLTSVEVAEGAEREKRKRDLQSRAFIQHVRPGTNPETAERDYQFHRDEVADQLFHGRGKQNDDVFNAEARDWLTREKFNREVVDSIGKAATREALWEGSGLLPSQRKGFVDWQAEAQKLKGYDPFAAGKYQADYAAALNKARDTFEPLREHIDRTWLALNSDADPGADTYVRMANDLSPLSRNETDAVIAAVRQRTEMLPPAEKENFLTRYAEIANRQLMRAATGDVTTGPAAAGSSVMDDEGQAAVRKWKGVFDDLRNIRELNIAPIPVGGWVDQIGATAAGSIPGLALSFASPWLLAGQFEDESFDQIRQNALKAGVDAATAEKWAGRLAPTAGILQAAIEKATFGIAKGKGPVAALQRQIIVHLAESAAAKRMLAAGGVEAAQQWGQEVVQDAIPAMVQDAAGAMGAPVPDADVMGALMKTASDPATLGVSIIFALGGGLTMPSVERAAAARRAGFTTEATGKLIAADTEAEVKAAWFEGVKTREARDPEAVAQERQGALADAQRTFADAGIAKVERAPDGWDVVGVDGTRTRVDSPEAARVLVDDLKMVRSQQEADAMVELADSFAAGDVAAKDRETRQQFTGDVVTATEEGVTAVRPGEAARVVTFDPEALANLHQEMAMRPEGERAAAAVILGENEYELRQRLAGDVNDLTVSLTTRQHTGSHVLTQVHERAEAMLRAGMARGTITEQEAKLFVADAAQLFDPAKARTAEDRSFRERVHRVARGEGTATELRETVSELVVADVLGRRKDGGRLPAGAITRGVDEAIRRATKPEEVTALGKFRAFLRAARDYFGQMFRAAAVVSKARREGKLFEGDDYTQFVDKLLGLDEQRAHNEAVVEAGGPAAAEAADVVARGGAGFALAPSMPIATPSPEADALRVGTAKLGTEAKPRSTPQTSNIGGHMVPEANLVKQLALVDAYPQTPQEIRDEQDPQKKRKLLIEHFKQNLLALIKAFPEELRRRATHWYDGANSIAKGFAQTYRVAVEQAAGVIAVLSPQKDWFSNVAQAEQVMDVWFNHQDTRLTTELVGATFEDIVNAAQAPKGQFKKPKPGESKLAKTRRRNYNERLNEQARNDRRALLEQIIGKTIRELDSDSYLQGWAIRVLAQATHGQSYRVISPEGAPMQVATNDDGSVASMAWGSIGEIEKAVRILKDGNLENISENLSQMHKVRSFYNNIVAPRSPQGDGTMDTHAVAAAWLLPLGSSAPEVLDNFSSEGSSPGTGINGLYHLYLDAYAAAGKDLGLLPRQVQSIAWEAIRGLFENKSKNVMAESLDAWKLPHGRARKQLLAGGIPPPAWHRPGRDRESKELAEGTGGEGVQTDSRGNLRFRGGTAAGTGTGAGLKGGAAFSIASADYLERLAPQLQAKGLPPKERARMFQRAQEQVAGMARAMRENDSTIGALRVAEIERERVERRKAREDELVGEIENRLSGILTQPELAQAQNGPLISRFLVKKPGEKFWRGTLLSKSAARKAGRDFRGEYDGAQGLPSWLFGGTEGPDTAAQEAWEAGLIPEATSDALWDGIRAELASAGRMAKALTEARTEVAEAKRTAATETREWAAKQRAALPRKQAGREKGEVMRALATLDAILMQFPPEVRGKVGGFYSVAKATTNEAREEALRSRVEKLDTVLEQHLRKEYTEELEKIFERAKPKKEAGKKPAGKAGADVHALFDALRDVQAMAADQVAGRVSDLATQLAQGLADGTITPEQEAMIERQAELTQLLGDWKNADAARMAEAVDAAHKTLADGLLAWTAHKLRQRERRTEQRASLRTDTGGLGPLSERKEEFDRQNGFRGMLKKWALNLSSFEQVMNFAFGKDSTVGKRLLEEESAASNQKADEEQAMADELQDLFTLLAGGSVYRGERLRWELSQRTINGGRAGKMSPLEAIQATMMWRQPDGRRHMEGKIDENGQPTGEWHYDQAWVDSIEKQLSVEAKKVREYLSNEYADEWETLNPLFRERHGVNLPQHANYSPLSVTPAFAKEGQMVDPVSGMTQPAGSTLTPGSLRTRSQTAVAEPDFKDALQLFIGHRKQMIHWRAYGGLAPEMSALLNDRGVGNSVEAKGGEQAKSVLRGWVNYFTEGGTRDAQAQLEINNSLNRMVRRASGAALIGRASTLMIQATQLAAASVQMPLPAYLARFGKLMTGNLGWGAALRSPYIQRRLAEMPAVVREGMMGLESGKPSRLRHEVARMGRLISGADALFTAGTYAILFDYHHGQAEKQGIYGAAADSYAHSAAEAATDRVAQPTRAAQRSILEATSTNPIFRASWAFASEARQKLAMAAWASADWKNPAQAAKVLALTWGVGGLAAQIIRNIFRDIRDDDDEEWFDEKNWSPKRLAFAALTGPLQGLPILGEAIELAAAKATGQFAPEGSLLSGMVDAAAAIHSLPKAIESGEPIEETIRKVESLMSGMAMADDRIAAMASVAHVATDLFRTLDAMVETEGEAGAKQLRKERKAEQDLKEAKQEAIPDDLKEAKEVAKKLKKEAEVKAAAVRARAPK
jgi:hypothetical protein